LAKTKSVRKNVISFAVFDVEFIEIRPQLSRKNILQQTDRQTISITQHNLLDREENREPASHSRQEATLQHKAIVTRKY